MTKGDKNAERLHAFLKDCLRFGCVKGFKHFSLYLRGREELVVSVHASDDGSPFLRTMPSLDVLNTSSLPPASPLMESGAALDFGTVFLVAGYARYKCPYVWLRSKTRRLHGVSHDASESPLQLRTTDAWGDAGANVRVWDIVEELISVSLATPPANPFELDLEFFSQLEPFESYLTTAAALNFLRKTYLLKTDTPYAAALAADIRQVSLLHFKAAPFVFGAVSAEHAGSGDDGADDE
eukprot:a178390_61.p1 GENE.a178390_61~~a178390_61.p1  ORF type:complete len:249 (-),score=63.65 a178390_61:48-761(-)